MKYYIDFDNTLYDTPKLIKAMLTLLTNAILGDHPDKEFEETYAECKSLFNREHFYNIYDLVDHFAHIYEPDTIPFLERLKAEGHNLYILSYCKESLRYQSAKISGSGIADYFDALYITSARKYELDIKYKDGIFIDDNPADLEGLYSKNPLKVIRMARNGNKYSTKELAIPEIKAYNSFDELKTH